MILDFSVLKSICVSFINIIIFENHLLIFCILNFCFVLSFVFVSCFIFVFIFLFLSLFFSFVLLSIFFLFFNIYIYWFFSLSDIFSCVFEHVPLLSTTILPLYDMLVTNLSLAPALELQQYPNWNSNLHCHYSNRTAVFQLLTYQWMISS